jgi:hypothetical protein
MEQLLASWEIVLCRITWQSYKIGLLLVHLKSSETKSFQKWAEHIQRHFHNSVIYKYSTPMKGEECYLFN